MLNNKTKAALNISAKSTTVNDTSVLNVKNLDNSLVAHFCQFCTEIIIIESWPNVAIYLISL